MGSVSPSKGAFAWAAALGAFVAFLPVGVAEHEVVTGSGTKDVDGPGYGSCVDFEVPLGGVIRGFSFASEGDWDIVWTDAGGHAFDGDDLNTDVEGWFGGELYRHPGGGIFAEAHGARACLWSSAYAGVPVAGDSSFTFELICAVSNASPDPPHLPGCGGTTNTRTGFRDVDRQLDALIWNDDAPLHIVDRIRGEIVAPLATDEPWRRAFFPVP